MKTCAKLFTDNLTSKDLNFQTRESKDGDTVVEFPYQGKVTNCFFGGDEGQYCSMYLVYERIPEDKLSDLIFLCNELNAEYKWVTYYVDKDNDLVMHLDAILCEQNAADVAFELLLRMLKVSEEIKPQIMKAIYA